jgi:hypothetical protein
MMERLLIFLILIFLITSCRQRQKSQASQTSIEPVSDESLARHHCGMCHVYPEPGKLDIDTWKSGVLPAMGPKMGIFKHGDEVYPAPDKGSPDLTRSIYPERPTISRNEWQRLIDYYAANAPEKPHPQVRERNIGKSVGLFTPVFPPLEMHGPVTTFVKLDAHRQLIFCEQSNGSCLNTYDSKLNKISSVSLNGAPTWMADDGGALYVTIIGSVYPSSKKNGMLQKLEINDLGYLTSPSVVLSNLPRPTQILGADIDGDGKKDWIVNGFGHLEGEFYWLSNGDASLKKVLRSEPGAMKTLIMDLTKDGRPDLITLFGQAREGIFLYENKGHGEFVERPLVEFSPATGSSGFDLVDMNGDGYLDIVYTAGDNADYSVGLKSFHGVYIYINDGYNNFSKKWFYPVNGCYKALCRDFDLDGDVDILSVSFFADYANQPDEILVLFTNQGNMEFLPTAVDGFQNGRWLTGDAADIDGDGDEDVILGNFSQGPGRPPEAAIRFWVNSPEFMVLKNNSR